jgi:outer membrane murein-binding lipoprotein Lpp
LTDNLRSSRIFLFILVDLKKMFKERLNNEEKLKKSSTLRERLGRKMKRGGIVVALVAASLGGYLGYNKYNQLRADSQAAQIAQELGNAGITRVDGITNVTNGGTSAIVGIEIAPANSTACVVKMNYIDTSGVASLYLNLKGGNGAVISKVDQFTNAQTEAAVVANLGQDISASGNQCPAPVTSN